jgi:hypothetical protein
MAWQLAEELDRRKASWTIDPFSPAPGNSQTIRTTAELIEGAGTCLDFAVTLAAMCVREGVPCHIAVAIESDRSIGHAFVVIQERVLAGGAGEGSSTHAASFASWVDLLAAPAPFRTELIDVTPRLHENPSSRIPVRQRSADLLKDWLRKASGTIYAVDVQTAVRMAGDYHRLPHTRRDLGLVGRLPDLPGDFEKFETHKSARTRLESAQGLIVLQGPSGSGKSTLALRRALQAEGGRGWFLDGSDERSLQNSLADAEARSGGARARNLQADYLKTMASAAGRRLSRTNQPWVVVLDNAEGEPSKLIQLIPRTKDGQLVIVTTTRDDWAKVVNKDQIIPVDPLEDADLDGFGLSNRLQEEEWFPGLLRILRMSRLDPNLLESFEGPIAERVVRAALDIRGNAWPENSRALAIAAASFMPAERVTVGWLASALFDDQRDIAHKVTLELAALGLLESSRQSFDVRERDEEPIWMHRLIRSTVRDMLPVDQSLIGWKVVACHTPRRRTNHYSDVELLELADFLETSAPETSRLGYAEAAFAVLELLEPRGSATVIRAAQLAHTAMRCIDPRISHGDAQITSIMLMARARRVNQANKPPPSPEEVQEAIEWCLQAEELTKGDATEDQLLTGRATAMRGLLMKRLAKLRSDLNAPIEEQISLLEESIEVLKQSYESRKMALEQEALRRGISVDDPDQHIDRGWFNLGGANVDLANALRHIDTDRIPRILSDAMEAYAGSLYLRRELDIPSDNTYSAASLWGIALTAYSAALSCPGQLNLGNVMPIDELELAVRNQTRETLLRTAELAGGKAVEMRVVIDDVAGGDTTKARDLLRKISMAWVVPGIESSVRATEVLKALKPYFGDTDITNEDIRVAAGPPDAE